MTLLILLTACFEGGTSSFEVCDLTIAPEPAEGRPGDTFTLIGGPLSTEVDPDLDAVVTVAGLRAEIASVDRNEGCDTCDECRIANNCLACGTCLECDSVCEACIESMVVRVPDATPPGVTRVTLVNAFGTGLAPFTVLTDEETGDTGSATAHTGGPTDTGVQGTGDTGTPTDTGSPATGDTGGPTDTGVQGTGDTSTPTDTGTVQPTAHTGGPADTGNPVLPPTGSTGQTGDTGASTPATGATGDTGAPPAGNTADTGP